MAIYRNEVIGLPRFVESQPVIDGDEFYGCHIEGPAVLFPSGTKITGCNTPDPAAMIWEVSNLKNPVNLAGGVLVKDCVFEGCTFRFPAISWEEPPHLASS